MKVDDFLNKQAPGQMTVQECIEEAEKSQFRTENGTELTEIVYTSLTPSGIEVAYSPAPRRYYKVRNHPDQIKHPLFSNYQGAFDWQEVPSVTTVLGVLDKSGPLIWWGQGVGVDGTLALIEGGSLRVDLNDDGNLVIDRDGLLVDKADVVRLLVQHKLSTNHVKDKAADRGTSVHSVFETWCDSPDYRPTPESYPESEQGYVTGLLKFLTDLGEVSDIESELMVGSLQHGFAGRFDARLVIPSPREMVVKCYPKRKPKLEEVPAGRWLLDVKTGKSVYDTHALQLAAYEMASVECGYGPTDHRAVIHLTADGQYELVQTNARPQDFLSILQCYTTMQGSKGWISPAKAVEGNQLGEKA